MRTMASSGVDQGRWEDLRKDARQLENDIEAKLVSFAKLCSGYGTEHDTSPLVSSGEHLFDTMALEIEQLLGKLAAVNDEMSSFVMRCPTPSPALSHNLQRHADILRDYTQEFRKAQAHRDREDLLGSRRDGRNSALKSSGLNRRSEYYVKENEHIMNSTRMADETLGIAVATKENLTAQRSTFSNMSARVGGMFSRFPAINNLMQRINVRKRRDTLILGAVIATCIILILLYKFGGTSA
eukprot:Opistho-1_new@76513